MLRKILFSAFFLTLFPLFLYGQQIYIPVKSANVKKSLIALPQFIFFGSPSVVKNFHSIGKDLYSTVRNDLTVSAYFTFINPGAYLEDPNKVGLRPAPGQANGFHFSKWKTIGAEFLVRGGFQVVKNQLILETYVYYVPQAKLVFGKKYQGPLRSARKIAHAFANDILEKLTGTKGMFTSKIVVSTDRSKRGTKEIYVMDWDAHNPVAVTKHKSIAISPAWAPDGKSVSYSVYAYHKKAKTRNLDLFRYELPTGKRWLVSYRKGMNSGSAFMPDNKYILLTLSQGGSPNIFRMTMDGKSLKRLTSSRSGAMNVEPAVSPDGRRIAFSSDRHGRPMIYVMDANGGNVQRITYAGKYNANPTWSPDGKRLAFAGQVKSNFEIYIIDVDSKTNLKRLTKAKKRTGGWADNESPTFSPDGRHIMFVSNRDGNRQIYIINPDGTNERRITFDRYNYYKPKWSPYLD